PHAVSQCLQSALHISVTHQCPSVPPISAHQCRLSVTIISAYQCSIIMPLHQCNLISAQQCCLSMPPHQCPSVLPISAASSKHIS
ncbi:unnamed protein product, partial [Staurois parvus]